MVVLNIVLVIAAVIVLLWVLLKFKEIRHRAFGVVLIIMLLVFFLSSMYVVNKKDIDLKSEGGVGDFFSSYGLWLSQAFGNTRVITGNVIGMDWGVNETVSIEAE